VQKRGPGGGALWFLRAAWSSRSTRITRSACIPTESCRAPRAVSRGRGLAGSVVRRDGVGGLAG